MPMIIIWVLVAFVGLLCCVHLFLRPANLQDINAIYRTEYPFSSIEWDIKVSVNCFIKALFKIESHILFPGKSCVTNHNATSFEMEV